MLKVSAIKMPSKVSMRKIENMYHCQELKTYHSCNEFQSLVYDVTTVLTHEWTQSFGQTVTTH